MEQSLDNGGRNGFILLAIDTPGCFNDVTEPLVPDLHRCAVPNPLPENDVAREPAGVLTLQEFYHVSIFQAMPS